MRCVSNESLGDTKNGAMAHAEQGQGDESSVMTPDAGTGSGDV